MEIKSFRESMVCQQLEANEAKRYISTQTIGSTIAVLDDCNSTNAILKSNFSKIPSDGCVIAARSQSNAKGSDNNKFHSPQGGLYFSFALKESIKSLNDGLLTIAASVSLCCAIKNCCGLDVQIVWPYDIYIENKKIGTIVSEKYREGYVCSIWVNVYKGRGEYPLDSGSLLDFSPTNLNINSLFGEILNCLENSLFHSSICDVLATYKRSSLFMGKAIQFIYGKNEITGIVIGIDSAASLIVQSGIDTINIAKGIINLVDSSNAQKCDIRFIPNAH